ncbi:MAG: hypothetical protein JKY31_02445 [Rhodobacteraceae bacterium]|nr:hypothetical protein [Paracoccaceae bacterium]
MKYLIGLAVILAAAFFFPQISQSVGGPCQALEAKVVSEIRAQDATAGLLAGLASSLSNGEVGRALAEQEYPKLPPALGCAIGYYTLDPKDIRI